MRQFIDRLEPRRLLNAGDLDTTFGDAGTRELSAPTIQFPFFPADIDSTKNNQVIVTGATSLPTDLENELGSVILWRLRGDGSVDTSFGPNGDGMVILPGASYATDTVSTVLTPDAGLLVRISNRLYKLKQNGSRDNGFGTRGRITLGAGVDYDPAVDQEGRIYVPGRGADQKLIIRRFKADGSVDRSYGVAGTLVPPGEIQPNNFTSRLLPTGKLLIGGTAAGTGAPGEFTTPGFDLVGLRLNADGSVDTTYGTGGVGRVQFFNSDLFTTSGSNPTITDDGRIFVNESQRSDISTNHSIDSLNPAGQEGGALVDDAIREAGFGDVVKDDSLFAMIVDNKVSYPFVVAEAEIGQQFSPSRLGIATDGSLLVAGLTATNNGESVNAGATQIIVKRLWRDDAPAVQSLARTLVKERSGSYRFIVQYRDDDAIERSTLGDDDITVQLPDGRRRKARLVKTDVLANAKVINATYLITSPDAEWDSRDNGTYSIRIERKSVRDSKFNFAAQRVIGTFVVQIPPNIIFPSAVLPQSIFSTASTDKKPLVDELTGDQA